MKHAAMLYQNAQDEDAFNKEGMGIGLLKVLFDLQISKIGDYTYHGMELLGKPDWVLDVESNTNPSQVHV